MNNENTNQENIENKDNILYYKIPQTEVLVPENENDEINEYTVYGVDLVTSTSGWSEAFKAPCKKLDL